MFDLSLEECVRVGGEVVTLAGFVVEPQEEREVAEWIVGGSDCYSFFFCTTDQVASG